MRRRKTAGQISQKAMQDTTKYNSMEVGHALTDDIAKELMICAQRHNDIFNEDEFCVGYVIASDAFLGNVMRRKFFAMLYLPSPRPNQAVFLFNKAKQQFTKRLWVLPNSLTMAELSEMTWVHSSWKNMKDWSDAFFGRRFWPFIRKQHNINMLSEIEYLHLHREELIKAGAKELPPGHTEAFDFSKVDINQVVDPNKTLSDQYVFDHRREAQNTDRHVSA